MKAFAVVKLVEQVWDNYHACIAKICADKDSTICAQMKYSISDKIKGGLLNDWPRDAKNKKVQDTGKLAFRVKTIPTWVCDPNHRKKLIKKRLYSKDCKANRVDIL